MSFDWSIKNYLRVASAIFLATIIYIYHNELSVTLSLSIIAIPSLFILKYFNKDNDFDVFKLALIIFLLLLSSVVFKVLASVALGLYILTVISYLIIQDWVYVSSLYFFKEEELIYWVRDSNFYWYVFSMLGIIFIACSNIGLEDFFRLYHTNLNIFLNWNEFLENPDLNQLKFNTMRFTKESTKSIMQGLTTKLFIFCMCINTIIPLFRDKVLKLFLE